MAKFSSKSKMKLSTCHPDIQRVMEEVIKHVDFTVLEGVRSRAQQEEYVRTGKSKIMKSKHLKQEDGYSHAIDIAPYPVDWQDKERFILLAGFVLGVAKSMGVSMRWGGDWDQDFTTKDHTFFDGPHFELMK